MRFLCDSVKIKGKKPCVSGKRSLDVILATYESSANGTTVGLALKVRERK